MLHNVSNEQKCKQAITILENIPELGMIFPQPGIFFPQSGKIIPRCVRLWVP